MKSHITSFNRMRFIAGRMLPIEAAIKHTERKFMTKEQRESIPASNFAMIHTHGPNNSLHMATPSRIALQHLKRIKLPSIIHAADLGSGFGNFCFTLSLLAENTRRISSFDITGFEVDPDILKEAERLRSNYAINGVVFKNEDFLANIDLAPYNLIYFFRPFLDDFHEKMGNILKNTLPGTMIISHVCKRGDLFPGRYFKRAYPRNETIPKLGVYGQFYAFIRR